MNWKLIVALQEVTRTGTAENGRRVVERERETGGTSG